MLTAENYLRIADDQERQDALMEAYTTARRAGDHAAALYAAEAALRARQDYPDATKIEFEYDPRDGVTDLMIYDAEGRELIDDDGYDDETEVTDILTNAMDQSRLFFGRPDGGVYTYELPPA